MKILIVDDEVSIRMTLAELFSHLGHKPHIASNATEALGILQTNEGFERIITDLKMPDMDGIEFTRRAKVLYPDIPVIMLSGSLTPEIEARALGAGVKAFVKKPFNIDHISKTVAAA